MTFEVSKDGKWTNMNGVIQFMYCWNCKAELIASKAFSCYGCERQREGNDSNYLISMLYCLPCHKKHQQEVRHSPR